MGQPKAEEVIQEERYKWEVDGSQDWEYYHATGSAGGVLRLGREAQGSGLRARNKRARLKELGNSGK